MTTTFPLGHQMILASAGSGKTHDLVTRFCTLLAAGVAPERIIALTFSRKSAGEFFSRILTRIAQAATSEAEAAKLEGAIHEQERQHAAHCGATERLPRAPLTQAAATELLVRLVRRLHLLSLGTMDSFFIRIARACPLELGLSGDFGILDPSQLQAVQQRIYQKIFSPQGAQRADQEDFFLAFQLATVGREETSLVRKLDQFIKDWYATFLEARPQSRWGQPSVIWSSGDAPRDPGLSVADAVRALRKHLERSSHPLNEKQVAVVQSFLEEMEPRRALQPVSDPTKGLLSKLAENCAPLHDGDAVLTLARTKVRLDPPLCQHFLTLLDALLYDDFTAGCLQTQGIWRILHRYEQHYDALVRQQGELSFADVQQLLSGDLAGEGQEGFALSRALLEFRLDAQFDHWLLDEFQDTNRRQWGILANLVEEVLQDDGGTRTFFAVGDAKQAIHMWRGSDPDLMERLLHRYAEGPQRIAVQSKSVSWRCAPAVLALVNEVLADRPLLKAWLPEGTLQEAWNFSTHTAAAANLQRPGVSEVLVVQNETKGRAKANKEVAALDLLCERLRALDPLARGLTCVVLVMTNKQALAAAEHLRASTPFAISCETDAKIVALDPTCAGLLDVLRWAVHPGDSLARQHLEMSPWQEVAQGMINATDCDPWPLVAMQVRQQISQEGFAATLRWWISHLRRCQPGLPAYSLARLRDLTGVATEFDLSGERGIDDFLSLAEAQMTREPSRATTIQVMTIFKAKGLEWDFVFATGLHDQTHGGAFDSDAIAYDDERRISWVTRVPTKDLALCNPTIQAMDAARQRWRWRQNLCLLYVLLTRAKSATHLILLAPSEQSTSKRLDLLLLEMLPPGNDVMVEFATGTALQRWLHGDATWFQSHPPLPLPAPLPPAADPPQPAPALPRPRLLRRRPSDLPSRSHFSPARHQALRTGTRVHAELARIHWLRPGQEKNLPEPLRTQLRQPTLAALFQEPTFPHQLWREQAFDLLLDGTLLSGVFDRVVIELNAQQQPCRAALMDFKTDPVTTPADATRAARPYHPQILIYRQALTQLLSLPPEAITMQLVFLSGGHVVNLAG